MILDTLQEDTRLQLVESIETRMLYSGPIPHPDLLKQFNEVTPDAADRIIKMAENQSAHRQEIEKSVIKAKTIDSRLGVLFAGLIGLAAVIGGIVLAAFDKELIGMVFSGGTLATLVGLYLKGTNLDKRDLENKK